MSFVVGSCWLSARWKRLMPNEKSSSQFYINAHIAQGVQNKIKRLEAQWFRSIALYNACTVYYLRVKPVPSVIGAKHLIPKMEIPFSLSRPHQHRKIRNVEVFPSSDCAHFPFPWNFVIRKIFIHLIWCSANQSKPSQQQNKERNVYNLQMNGVSLFRHISMNATVDWLA